MPQVTKQSPAPRKVVKTGNILDEIVPVTEVDDEWLQIVIYGQNRVGKTTLACQFPKPLLLLAMEPNRTGGAMSVRKIPGVDFHRLSSKDQIVRMAAALKGGNAESKCMPGKAYQTVVLDSATSLQDIVLKKILGLTEMPEMLSWGSVSLQQYRERSEQTRECLRPFLNLPMHVVILGKEKDHNPPDKDKPEMLRGFTPESYIATDLGGQTAGWLHDACDYLCRLSIDKELVERKVKTGKGPDGKDTFITRVEETGRMVRRLRTAYHPNYASGFRSANPKNVPEFIIDPSFAKIWEVIKG